MKFRISQFFWKNRTIAFAAFCLLLSQDAWCFTTGVRSLDYLFGTTTGKAIAIAEFLCIIGFIFQLLRVKKGHDDELWNLGWILFIGILIPFVPDIFTALAGISSNAGVQGGQGAWNGSSPNPQ